MSPYLVNILAWSYSLLSRVFKERETCEVDKASWCCRRSCEHRFCFRYGPRGMAMKLCLWLWGCLRGILERVMWLRERQGQAIAFCCHCCWLHCCLFNKESLPSPYARKVVIRPTSLVKCKAENRWREDRVGSEVGYWGGTSRNVVEISRTDQKIGLEER